jgi:hypothetical protein
MVIQNKLIAKNKKEEEFISKFKWIFERIDEAILLGRHHVNIVEPISFSKEIGSFKEEMEFLGYIINIIPNNINTLYLSIVWK